MHRVAAVILGTLAVLGIFTTPASAASHDGTSATGLYDSADSAFFNPRLDETNMVMNG